MQRGTALLHFVVYTSIESAGLRIPNDVDVHSVWHVFVTSKLEWKCKEDYLRT